MYVVCCVRQRRPVSILYEIESTIFKQYIVYILWIFFKEFINR